MHDHFQSIDLGEGPRVAERILILDDEERISSLCAKMLTRSGYDVLAPAYGSEAIEIALAGDYDLLLTDYNMPDKNGIAIFQEVQKAGHDVTAVLVTANATAEVLTHALEAGVSSFIPKPFTAEELRRGVDLALGKARIQKENARLRGLVALLELRLKLACDANQEGLFEAMMEVASRKLMADRTSILVRTQEGNRMRLAASRGLPAELPKDGLTDVSGTISGYVLENGRSVLINGEVVSPDLVSLLRFSSLSSGVCVPIRDKSGVVGVLSAGRQQPREGFKESDLKFLEDFANHLFAGHDANSCREELRENCLRAVGTIMAEIESREPCLKGHSAGVADCAVRLARECGLGAAAVDELRMAALIHDVGRLGVSACHGQKKPDWTVADMFRMKNHVQYSEKILKASTLPDTIIRTVKHHHEWYSGAGYPDGLAGERIPLEARILRVADTADAISSDRSYRSMYSPNEFLGEMNRGRGTQFDPAILDAALRLHERKSLLHHAHPYYQTA